MKHILCDVTEKSCCVFCDSHAKFYLAFLIPEDDAVDSLLERIVQSLTAFLFDNASENQTLHVERKSRLKRRDLVVAKPPPYMAPKSNVYPLSCHFDSIKHIDSSFSPAQQLRILTLMTCFVQSR